MNILILSKAKPPAHERTLLADNDTVVQIGLRELSRSPNAADQHLRGVSFDLIVMKNITWADVPVELVLPLEATLKAGGKSVIVQER